MVYLCAESQYSCYFPLETVSFKFRNIQVDMYTCYIPRLSLN